MHRRFPDDQWWHDPSLPLIAGDAATPPAGFVLRPFLCDPPEAVVVGKPRYAYHCSACDGWIMGYPHHHRVDTLGPMHGRSGWETFCVRCGREIAFQGKMA